MKNLTRVFSFALLLLLAGTGFAQTYINGPLVITLPPGGGDAIKILDSNNVVVGGVRKDAAGRPAFFGQNYTSNAFVIQSNDKIHIGPSPAATQNIRLKIEDDVQLTGALRVGLDQAFGNFPIDPRGAIQVGRTSATGQNQAMSLIRMYRYNHSTSQAEEVGRMGVDADGFPTLMQGTNDTPLITYRPSGAVWLYGDYNGQRIGVELTINNGSLKGQHGVSGKVTDVVPQ